MVKCVYFQGTSKEKALTVFRRKKSLRRSSLCNDNKEIKMTKEVMNSVLIKSADNVSNKLTKAEDVNLVAIKFGSEENYKHSSGDIGNEENYKQCRGNIGSEGNNKHCEGDIGNVSVESEDLTDTENSLKECHTSDNDKIINIQNQNISNDFGICHDSGISTSLDLTHSSSVDDDCVAEGRKTRKRYRKKKKVKKQQLEYAVHSATDVVCSSEQVVAKKKSTNTKRDSKYSDTQCETLEPKTECNVYITKASANGRNHAGNGNSSDQRSCPRNEQRTDQVKYL